MQYILHLTKNCNFSCDYCTVPKSDTIMDRSIWSKICDYALGNAINENEGHVTIGFYGGEPLLCKELVHEIVEYCSVISKGKNVSFDYMITTNGWLLDDDFIKFAIKNRIEIGISLDGIKVAHDLHRRTTTSLPTFKHVYRVSRDLISKIPKSYVMLTINPDTIRYLFKSIKFLYKMGFKTVSTAPNFVIDWSNNDFQELRYQYESMAEWYKNVLVNKEDFKLPLFDNKLMNHIGTDKCTPAKHRISIDVNGDIYPCIQFVERKEYIIGKVQDEVVVNSGRVCEIVHENMKGIEKCSKCNLASRCDNKCSCKNLLSNNSLSMISPKICAHEHILIPITDELWGLYGNESS